MKKLIIENQDVNDRLLSTTQIDNPETDVQQTSEILPAEDAQKSLEISPEKTLEIDDNIEQEGYMDASPTVEFLKTMRHVGYSNYTALEELVDNAIDTDVDAKNVKIKIHQKKKNGEYDYIKICDDGGGIDKNTIKQAFKLGAKTGKIKAIDLGAYGTGQKSAILSMGRRYEVRTKAEDKPFYIVTYDMDDIIEKQKYIIPIRLGTDKEYVEFMKEVESKTGTIITLQKLDRMTNKNLDIFVSTLIEKFGMTYKYFIDEFNVNITINGKPVRSIDPMCRHELEIKCFTENEKFSYLGHEFKFSVYNIERMRDDTKRAKELKRGKPTAGLYIYRNKRLVGRALDLGILNITGDGHCNGVRIELFVDGDSDSLFGSTFTKVIYEKNKCDLDQSFRDICCSKIGYYIGIIRNVENQQLKTEKLSEEIKQQQDSVYDGINKNSFIDVKKKGINHPREIPVIKPEPTGIKRTFKGRRRNDKYADWEMVNYGENGILYIPTKKNGLYVIQINQEHPFWVEFLKDAGYEVRDFINKFFVAEAIALETTSYYEDGEKNIHLNEYMLQRSEHLRKLIMG